jgi:type I restriction enzyme R subunit
MPLTPEKEARAAIDEALAATGWVVQDPSAANLNAGRGVAVREFPLEGGPADYLLFLDGRASGVIEAKPEGTTLTGVEAQTERYSQSIPGGIPRHRLPLPFLYQSTGVETRFTNGLDPEPRSRRTFHFHRPEMLAAWLAQAPSTLRNRLRQMPPLQETGLWPVQVRAVHNLEESLAEDRPRALIQMATGSGKTHVAIATSYRLLRHANANRVLFLVDRANLGRQALKEFQAYRTPDDGRKLTELYNVQLLTSNHIDPVARVVITTVQRLYAMLRGAGELDPLVEEASQFDTGYGLVREVVPIAYNPSLPIEFFDIVFIDECHRSIYDLWRQVVEYFDAHLIGLTATPSKQTLGFFNQNLVMEYEHDEAVADAVNVDFMVYRIRTHITEAGSLVEAGNYIDKRDRATRRVRWEQLDEDLVYDERTLDRQVVAVDQIRTLVRTFRDKLFTEIFPGRTQVPKTLVYAKDDSHADDIVQAIREEFAKGNDFCQKITYRTTGVKPEDLIQAFRNSFNPRIVVTVDMIATGTDIKPLELVMFMRPVRSRIFFEQMKGRGVRIIDPNDLQAVTPDALAKTHFVIVDCVGACESELSDTRPLERKPSLIFGQLLKLVSFGNTEADIVSSLASRLVRLERVLGDEDQETVARVAHGTALRSLVRGLILALDPDEHIEIARAQAGLSDDQQPTPEQVASAAQAVREAALKPFAANPELRALLTDLKTHSEQTIDTVSKDTILEASYSESARERARTLVTSFAEFIREHKDEITALQMLYSQPYTQRLRYEDVKALADALRAPPRGWTPEALWRAYETLEKDRVRGGSDRRLLTDVVRLVRFALGQEDMLVPNAERVNERFTRWLREQEANGRQFTRDQRLWLEMIRDHIAGSYEIRMEDFDLNPFAAKGGAGAAVRIFGERVERIMSELNEVLAG